MSGVSEYRKFPEEPPQWVRKLLKNDNGLGDTVERITTKTGIKGAVDYLSEKTGKGCGCQGRKEYLNSWVKYR
jgi:hypothetical protein|tara:strand:+ start:787 stop:1005 length:219 start_codon:yes stop_codon:yes gene_type:complete